MNLLKPSICIYSALVELQYTNTVCWEMMMYISEYIQTVLYIGYRFISPIFSKSTKWKQFLIEISGFERKCGDSGQSMVSAIVGIVCVEMYARSLSSLFCVYTHIYSDVWNHTAINLNGSAWSTIDGE